MDLEGAVDDDAALPLRGHRGDSTPCEASRRIVAAQMARDHPPRLLAVLTSLWRSFTILALKPFGLGWLV